jgi:transcriptional regulator with XRE-family HTH domain
MSLYNNVPSETSAEIEKTISNRIENIRLSRNITQARLARESGLSLRTIKRIENGSGVSLNTFIRVLMALGIHHNLDALLPDPKVRPIERVGFRSKIRKRARSSKKSVAEGNWVWGDCGGHE